MTTRIIGWFSVLAATWACACEADMSKMDSFEPDASIAVAETQEALGVLFHASWSQGQPRVELGSAEVLFCWLTEIQGHFQGGGERVRVYVENGKWWLHGNSAQTGVAAKARCTPVNLHGRTLNVTTERKWTQSQGNEKTPLAPDDGFTTCVLTRVEGHFEGSGEAVEITRSNGQWLLGGRSAKSGVAAGARCVSSVFAGQGTATHSADCRAESCPFFLECSSAVCFGEPDTDLGPVAAPSEIWGPGVNIACGLGSMSGKFKGGAERVRIYLSDGRWKLEATGRQTSVYTTSGFCFL